jgi:hypothetical protein
VQNEDSAKEFSQTIMLSGQKEVCLISEENQEKSRGKNLFNKGFWNFAEACR